MHPSTRLNTAHGWVFLYHISLSYLILVERPQVLVTWVTSHLCCQESSVTTRNWATCGSCNFGLTQCSYGSHARWWVTSRRQLEWRYGKCPRRQWVQPSAWHQASDMVSSPRQIANVGSRPYTGLKTTSTINIGAVVDSSDIMTVIVRRHHQMFHQI